MVKFLQTYLIILKNKIFLVTFFLHYLLDKHHEQTNEQTRNTSQSFEKLTKSTKICTNS